MLIPAFFYRERLNLIMTEAYTKEKNKYYFSDGYLQYNAVFDDTNYHSCEMVCVDKDDRILGFMSYRLNRNENRVYGLSVINFHEMNMTFSKDLHVFLDEIFSKFQRNKLNFRCVDGNPAKKMYDKYVKKYNGRLVGTFKENVKLIDGTLCDEHVYEIMLSDYLSSKDKRKEEAK